MRLYNLKTALWFAVTATNVKPENCKAVVDVAMAFYLKNLFQDQADSMDKPFCESCANRHYTDEKHKSPDPSQVLEGCTEYIQWDLSAAKQAITRARKNLGC